MMQRSVPYTREEKYASETLHGEIKRVKRLIHSSSTIGKALTSLENGGDIDTVISENHVYKPEDGEI
jgi:hypothetical protein